MTSPPFRRIQVLKLVDPFGHFDYAGTVAQVVVYSVTTGITAIGKQDTFPENSIVVIMIVSDKYS